MIQKFCKILEVQGHQVLIRTTTNEEGEEAIVITTVLEGMEMSASITGFEKNNETIESKFEKTGQKNAEAFFQSMYNLTQE